MKAYIVEVLIVDHDELGPEGIKDALEHARYANDCVMPRVLASTEYEIGQWTDQHPLNYRGTDAKAWLDAFDKQEW